MCFDIPSKSIEFPVLLSSDQNEGVSRNRYWRCCQVPKRTRCIQSCRGLCKSSWTSGIDFWTNRIIRRILEIVPGQSACLLCMQYGLPGSIDDMDEEQKQTLIESYDSDPTWSGKGPCSVTKPAPIRAGRIVADLLDADVGACKAHAHGLHACVHACMHACILWAIWFPSP